MQQAATLTSANYHITCDIVASLSPSLYNPRISTPRTITHERNLPLWDNFPYHNYPVGQSPNLIGSLVKSSIVSLTNANCVV